MSLTMRGRLTLWYAVILASFLGVLCLASYVFLTFASLERVDEFLAESAATIASAIEFERKQGAADSTAIASVLAAITLPDVAIHVYDRASGRDLTSFAGTRLRGESGAGVEDSLASQLTATARNAGEDPALSSFQLGGTEWRRLTLPYSLAAEGIVVTIAQAMVARSRLLSDARVAIAVGLPLAILLSSLGGWWLSGRSLAPMNEMSRRARAISASTLHDRLPVANPDDELGRLAVTFNELLERLDQAFNAQSQFVADASHELRTPVAVISGEAELALSRPDRSTTELTEALRAIRAESLELRSVVEDLFLLARADAGERPSRQSQINLRQVVDETAIAVRTLAASRNIALTVVGKTTAPCIGDDALLRRAVRNLLVNAIHYSGEGTSVIAELGDDGKAAWVDVRDAGPGIAVGLADRVFDRFVRSDEARGSSYAGAGLGLAIVRSVARAHGGEAALIASSPSGTSIRFSLPRSDAGAVR